MQATLTMQQLVVQTERLPWWTDLDNWTNSLAAWPLGSQ